MGGQSGPKQVRVGQSKSEWVGAGENGSKQVKAFVKLGQSMSKQVRIGQIGPRGPKRVKLVFIGFYVWFMMLKVL